MKLNLPILDQLADSENILIAGAGGGHDVLAGLPIYFTLRDLGKTVHLANYSFTQFELISVLSEPAVLIENFLIGAHGPLKSKMALYFPEGYLSVWLSAKLDEKITVWMFRKSGAFPLAQAYAKLVEHLNIDALILVDGGVDSIMRGDEQGAGTLIEDSISLAAASTLDLPVKILACIGFGTEFEEDVCHYTALENIAALTRAGGFLGNCALTPQMPAFQQFEAACRFIWEDMDNPLSHITTRVIPAAHGEFGNVRMYPKDDSLLAVPLSPLMSLYWFFDANTVIAHNLLIELLRPTHSTQEAFSRFFAWRQESKITIRQRRSIPY